MESAWMEQLKVELSQPYMKDLENFLKEEREKYEVYPPKELVFSAFKETPFEKVKVVIVGQDPYHGTGQAHGMSFSVPEGVRLPPSLKNIFSELETDLHIPRPSTGYLMPWAKQGVFLLNATLTVRAHEPKSHYGKGWERFTDAVIDVLLKRETPMVFLLWGQSAQEKGGKVEASAIHKVLTAAHPSPYSVSRFFGCKHFSQTNELLKKWGQEPINWDLNC